MAGELTAADLTHGYYEFDGQVAGESIDKSGNGFNFSVVGATDVASGKFSNGLEFDGINDYGFSAQSRYSGLTDQLGIFGWMQLLRTSTLVDSYLWKGSVVGQDIVLYGNNDTRIHYRINDVSDSGITDSRGTINPFFFAANYDGVDATIYWNDPTANISSSAQTGNITNTDDLYIGARTDVTGFANVIFSQLGIRNAPFTMDEMVYMYNGGAGRLLTDGPAFNPAWARNSNQIIGMPQ